MSIAGPGAARGSAGSALLHHLVEAGYDRVEPPLLHDAATFLDLGGEDIRARLYLTADGAGAELCLRPEYTIPAARAYLASPQAGRPAAYSYCGPVFRLRAGGPGEFLQAGLESFGRVDTAAADAEILALSLDAVERSGTRLLRVSLGDAGLVSALLDAIALPPLWQRRLKRGLEKGLGIEAVLRGAPTRRPEHSGLLAALAGADGKDAHALVADLLSIAGIATVGGRSVGEIADRYLAQVEQGAAPDFGDERRRVLEGFFAVAGEPDRASHQMRALAEDAGLDLGAALDLFDERTGFIATQGVDLRRLAFRTAFARNLDYYTGFVFEAHGAHPDGPVIGGGRYDRLAQALGHPDPVPAVGAAIWLDRLDPEDDSVSAEKPFVLAVPSKGRLQENAFAFFARAGLRLVQGGGSRDYRGRLDGFQGLEIAFLPVSEIVTQLADGSAHLGVAGEDVLREAIPDTDGSVAFLSRLGFGNADVVVAVPRAWIDVRTMADLEDVAAGFHARRGRRMRVATKYVNLTRRFFAERGVTDYRIVESLGATEGAPAAGGAELIVDITTTGATLQANALKVLDDGVMLRSEANLAASLSADWSAAHRATARGILGRIAAEERARTSRELRANFPNGVPGVERSALEGFDVSLIGREDGRLVLHCPKGRVPDLADWLIGQGAGEVSVVALDYVFAARNPLYDALVARLG